MEAYRIIKIVICVLLAIAGLLCLTLAACNKQGASVNFGWMGATLETLAALVWVLS